MIPKRESDAPNNAPKKPAKSEDVALVYGRTNDGKGLRVIRKREKVVETATLQPLEEGKPIIGEVLQLRPRGEGPLCDVEVLLPASETAAEVALKGPGQVASDAYRKNWDSIYNRGDGKPSNKKLLN